MLINNDLKNFVIEGNEDKVAVLKKTVSDEEKNIGENIEKNETEITNVKEILVSEIKC